MGGEGVQRTPEVGNAVVFTEMGLGVGGVGARLYSTPTLGSLVLWGLGVGGVGVLVESSEIA